MTGNIAAEQRHITRQLVLETALAYIIDNCIHNLRRAYQRAAGYLEGHLPGSSTMMTCIQTTVINQGTE